MERTPQDGSNEPKDNQKKDARPQSQAEWVSNAEAKVCEANDSIKQAADAILRLKSAKPNAG